MDRMDLLVLIQSSHTLLCFGLDFSGSRVMIVVLLITAWNEGLILSQPESSHIPSRIFKCVLQLSLSFLVSLGYHGLLLRQLAVLCTRNVILYHRDGLAPRKSILTLSYPCASGACDFLSLAIVTLPTSAHVLAA